MLTEGPCTVSARGMWPNVKLSPKLLNNRLLPRNGVDTPSLKRAGTILFLGVGSSRSSSPWLDLLPWLRRLRPDHKRPWGHLQGRRLQFVQPSSDVFNASVAILGIALLVTAYFLWKGSGYKALTLFEGLAGIGCIGIGTFNESYGGTHVFFSAFTFFSIGIQALFVYKVAKAPLSYFSAAAGVITLLAIVLYGTDTYLGLGQGGMERMIVYPVLIGGLAFGGYLMAIGESYMR